MRLEFSMNMAWIALKFSGDVFYTLMMKEEYFSLSFHDLSIALEPNFLIF